MSDEEMFVGVNDEEEDEYDFPIKEELIALVKANPALYAKNWKEYAGKNFNKDLTWKSIGYSLSKQISGKDAAKIWYNIRQRFGRERRKVLAALKGKSGQETKPLYVPKWSLYPLCLFLAISCLADDAASVSSIEDNKRKESSVIHASTSSSNSLNIMECFAPVTALSPSKEVLKTIQKTPIKRSVPEPDYFAKRRKKEDDFFIQAIAKQSTVLTNFATKLEESLMNRSSVTNSDQCISQANVSTASSVLSVDDPVLVAIGYALKSVPEEKRLECICEVLNVIKSKYLQR